EPAAFLEQQNRGGGELLRDRADPELRFAGIRYFPLQVRVAVAPLEQRLAASGDEHRAHEPHSVRLGPDDFVHALDVLGEGAEWRKQHETEDERRKKATRAETHRHYRSPFRDLRVAA